MYTAMKGVAHLFAYRDVMFLDFPMVEFSLVYTYFVKFSDATGLIPLPIIV